MGRGLVLVLALASVASADARLKEGLERLRSRDADTRWQGTQILADLGPAAKPAVPHLAKALGDDAWSVRHGAHEALTRIGTAGVEGLVRALRTKDAAVRAGILGVLREKHLVTATWPYAKKLVPVLADEDETVRTAGVRLFGAMGGPGVEALFPALRARKDHAREAAVAALAAAGTKSIRRIGAVCVKSKSPHIRAGICKAIGLMGKAGAGGASVLIRMLEAKRETVRGEAARALGRTGAGFEKAEAVLFAGLAAESEEMREGCIDGLAAYGRSKEHAKDAAAGLVARLESDAARASAAEALYRMGFAARDPLQEALRDAGDPARRAAVGVLVRFKVAAKETEPGLRRCLKAKDPALRRDAAAALGRLGRAQFVVRGRDADPKTVDALAAAAADEDATVRAAVARSLGRLGGATARATVEPMRKDKDPGVRMAALAAGWGAGTDRATTLASLRAGLDDAAARAHAAAALGDVGIAAAEAVPALTDLLEDEEAAVRRSAAWALGRIVRPGLDEVRRLRGTWEKRSQADVRKAIEHGLRWLAENQTEDGLWDADKHGGGALYDAGVTGLALWAMLGAGKTDSPAVIRGLDYLMRIQTVDGVIGTRATHSFMSCHAFAGAVLAEALLLTGDRRYRRAVEAAVDFAEMARNPGSAWRYEPRGGENDTHITSEVVTLLRLAEMGGVAVAPETYVGAAAWLTHMTDPNFGQVGYNYPGGASARPERKQELFPPEHSHAMTAAGTWARQLIGGALLKDPAYEKSVRLCGEIPPSWARERRDLFYFQFGALVVQQDDGRAWTKWKPALFKTFVTAQNDDGSWPNNGVWGEDGGTVYATSMAVLSLLTPYRYPPGFASDPGLTGDERAVTAALRRARKDDDPTVAAAAEAALRAIVRDA